MCSRMAQFDSAFWVLPSGFHDHLKRKQLPSRKWRLKRSFISEIGAVVPSVREVEGVPYQYLSGGDCARVRLALSLICFSLAACLNKLQGNSAMRTPNLVFVIPKLQ
jgi:hypothetical protein